MPLDVYITCSKFHLVDGVCQLKGKKTASALCSVGSLLCVYQTGPFHVTEISAYLGCNTDTFKLLTA